MNQWQTLWSVLASLYTFAPNSYYSSLLGEESSPVCHTACGKQNKYRSSSPMLLASSFHFFSPLIFVMVRIDCQLDRMWNHIGDKLPGNTCEGLPWFNWPMYLNVRGYVDSAKWKRKSQLAGEYWKSNVDTSIDFPHLYSCGCNGRSYLTFSHHGGL